MTCIQQFYHAGYLPKVLQMQVHPLQLLELHVLRIRSRCVQGELIRQYVVLQYRHPCGSSYHC